MARSCSFNKKISPEGLDDPPGYVRRILCATDIQPRTRSLLTTLRPDALPERYSSRAVGILPSAGALQALLTILGGM